MKQFRQNKSQKQLIIHIQFLRTCRTKCLDLQFKLQGWQNERTGNNLKISKTLPQVFIIVLQSNKRLRAINVYVPRQRRSYKNHNQIEETMRVRLVDARQSTMQRKHSLIELFGYFVDLTQLTCNLFKDQCIVFILRNCHRFSVTITIQLQTKKSICNNSL